MLLSYCIYEFFFDVFDVDFISIIGRVRISRVKRVVASSWLPVRHCARISAAHTRRISVKFDTVAFYENLLETRHIWSNSDDNFGNLTYILLLPATHIRHNSIFLQHSMFYVVNRDM